MQVSQPQRTPLKLIYPPSTLQQTTIENAKRIHHLEHLIRTERQELDRLLQNSSANKRIRHSSQSPSTPPNPPTPPTPPTPPPPTTPPPASSPPSLSSNVHISTTAPTTPTIPTTPPAPSQATPQSSPKGIMFPCQNSVPSPQSSDRKPPSREMAARGSHWSFVEKARFEAALHKYGPFAWDQIIRTVGTRSEKQVKAYAARYRRRKKLAAKAQLEAAERLPTQNPSQNHAALPSSAQPSQPVKSIPLPAPTDEQRSGSSDRSTCLEPSSQADGFLKSEEDNVNDATFCDVFGGNSLFGTPLVDSTAELPHVSDEHSDPAEVELLVDQALQGEFVMDDKAGQERGVETLEGDYSSDFLNTVFTQ